MKCKIIKIVVVVAGVKKRKTSKKPLIIKTRDGFFSVKDVV